MTAAMRIVACGSALAGTLAAQTVRGVVFDPAHHPVPGAVVMIVDEQSATVGRALTNADGEFRVVAPVAGRYRLRTMRIGFRPWLSDVVTLTAGQMTSQDVSLAAVPLMLDTLRATGAASCRLSARDSAAATWKVWEQVQTALNAAQLTAAGRAINASTVTYQRTLDLTRKHVIAQTASVRTEVVTQPWRSSPIDSLRRFGYVTVDDRAMTTSYRAPGLDVLLSPTFLEDHCLKLVHPKVANRVGIEFQPNDDRRKISDIAGTVLLDAKTSELKSLEYRYANVSKDVEQNAGGSLEFARITSGAWVVSRWNIRMPVFVDQRENDLTMQQVTKINAIQITGGELALITTVASRGADTLWSRPPLSIRGTVVDSASNHAVANARVSISGTLYESVSDRDGHFVLHGVIPGTYVVETRTASLDSLNAVSESTRMFTDSVTALEIRVPTGTELVTQLCGATLGHGLGILIGSVGARYDTLPQAGAMVRAEWADVVVQDNTAARERRMNETKTDANGSFRMCGVPVNTALTLRASRDSASAPATAVRIPPDMKFMRADLILDRQIVAAATFQGVVLTDTTHQPIGGAEISLPDLALSALSDSAGRFRLSEIPSGEHHLIIRRIGFGPVDTKLRFAPSQVVDRTVYLNKVVTLDSMLVSARRGIVSQDLPMVQFAENKARGIGKFFDRDDLERMNGRPLGSVLAQTPGLEEIRGRAGQAWVVGKRAPITRCIGLTDQPAIDDCLRSERQYYVPEGFELKDGMARACYAQVYVDRILRNNGIPTPPFDLNELGAIQVEALEWYASSAEVPPQYFGRQSACGLLIIHTRR